MRPVRVMVAALTIVSVGCSPASNPPVDPAPKVTSVELTVVDGEYQPSRITVPAGIPVSIRLSNEGSMKHGLFAAPDDRFFPDGWEWTPVRPGESGGISLTAPKEPGEYVMYCHVDDHRERGEELILVVK